MAFGHFLRSILQKKWVALLGAIGFREAFANFSEGQGTEVTEEKGGQRSDRTDTALDRV